MRLIPFFLTLILFSCGGNEAGVDEELGDSDSSSAGIIEHDLDEERLDAVGYNNKLNAIISSTLDDIDLLFSSDSSNVEQNLENTLFNLDLNHTAVVETPEFETEEPFRLSVLELLAFYVNELNGAFASEVKPILMKGEPSDVDQAYLEEYDLTFSGKEKGLFDAMMLAQEEFAGKNNIRLSE